MSSPLSQRWQNVVHFVNGDLQTQTHSQITFSQEIPRIPALNGLQTLWKIQLVCTPYDHGFLVCSWECQTIITVSQFHKWIEKILKEDSQCYQARRHLIHLILLLMYNEMQKSLSFLQTIWLMEEMLLIFDTSVGGVVMSSGGHDQSSKLTWSDREMNRKFGREMNRWINKRMFNVPTMTFRKGNTNTRWVVSAKQQYGRGRFRDERGTQYELVSRMVLQKKEMSP